MLRVYMKYMAVIFLTSKQPFQYLDIKESNIFFKVNNHDNMLYHRSDTVFLVTVRNKR